MQTTFGIIIKLIKMLIKVINQGSPMSQTLVGIADGIEFELQTIQAEIVPETLRHRDDLGVNVRPAKPDRLDPDLMKLPITPTLRTLVAKHWTEIPQASGALVGEMVFNHGPNHPRGILGAQGQVLAIERVDKGIHLFFDNIGGRTNTPRKQRCRFDDRRPDLLIAVTAGPVTNGFFDQFPQVGIGRQQVVHPLHAGENAGLGSAHAGSV